MQPDLTFRALNLLLITLLALKPCRFHFDLTLEDNRFGWPLRGVIWFYLANLGSCAPIVLAEYAQKATSIERVTQRMEAVTFQGD